MRDSVHKFLPPSPHGDQLCLVPSSSFQFVILNMGLNHFGKQYTYNQNTCTSNITTCNRFNIKNTIT